MNQDSTKYAIEVKNATVRFNMASEKVDNLKEYMARKGRCTPIRCVVRN